MFLTEIVKILLLVLMTIIIEKRFFIIAYEENRNSSLFIQDFCRLFSCLLEVIFWDLRIFKLFVGLIIHHTSMIWCLCFCVLVAVVCVCVVGCVLVGVVYVCVYVWMVIISQSNIKIIISLHDCLWR